jgi:rubrerythrin
MYRVIFDKTRDSWVAVEAKSEFKGRTYDKAEAQQIADQRNEGTTYKCAQCDNPFAVTVKEAKWYEEKGFSIPKRCPSCRHKRRTERTEKTNNK